MDKKSLIGLALITVILGVWLTFSGPSKEQIARNKHVKDSIELAQKKAIEEEAKKITASTKIIEDTLKTETVLSDSAKQALLVNNYRDFSVAANGSEEIVTIENNLLKAYISNKGGQIIKVELKKYNRSGQTEPLILFDKDSTFFSLKLDAYERSLMLSTDSFYFKPSEKNLNATSVSKSVRLKLETSKPGAYIEYTYTLKPDDYLIDFDIRFAGMQNIISSNVDQMILNWQMMMPSQEKYIVKEKEAATAYYKFTVDDPDYINPRKDEEKNLNDAPIKWVCFKQQFFNTTLIAENEFLKDGSFVKTSSRPNSKSIVKHVSTDLGIPFNHTADEKFKMKFYFGPTHFNTLKQYDYDLEKIIPTGWSIFSYINRWMVIPLFNAFSNLNYGIVILILTLILKLILLPIAYKTYMSGARMRVLKPETEAITAKYANNADPMKKQQETMALYRKAGVNPLSGCIPLLLQFPILIALFNFVPAAIELRQKGFLWADDLSTYDSIWTFGEVPVINSIYGDHISLFALMMFVSTIIYTWMNSNMLTPQQGTQMPGMKFMMYFMPVIFLAVMNSYAAGLSWYYFLANMITFLQTWIMKKLIDDKKIRAKIDENMKKPVKTSSFQKRLEEMAKQRQLQQKKK